MFKRARFLVAMVVAAILFALAAKPMSSAAVIFAGNVPIIVFPPAPDTPTTPQSGVTVETIPGPPNPPFRSTAPKKLYVYIVRESDYRVDTEPEKHTPGVNGTPLKVVSNEQRERFHWNLNSASSGSTYIVVGLEEVDTKDGERWEYNHKNRRFIKVDRQ